MTNRLSKGGRRLHLRRNAAQSNHARNMHKYVARVSSLTQEMDGPNVKGRLPRRVFAGLQGGNDMQLVGDALTAGGTCTDCCQEDFEWQLSDEYNTSDSGSGMKAYKGL